MTLWEGRISTGMADAVAAFTISLPFDKALAPDDLAGSRAHAAMLAATGVITTIWPARAPTSRASARRVSSATAR